MKLMSTLNCSLLFPVLLVFWQPTSDVGYSAYQSIVKHSSHESFKKWSVTVCREVTTKVRASWLAS